MEGFPVETFIPRGGSRLGKEASPYAHIVHVEARTRCTSKAAERVINFAD